MSNVSLERYYFVLYDGALTLKMSKMALNAFCDKTLHTVRPNKKETRVISEISSLPRKNETNCMLHFQEQFLFFHLIPNT